MPRILLFLLLIFLVWTAVRWLGGLRKSERQARGTPDDASAAPRPGIETMRQCAWCGAHAPSTDAVALPDGRVYCSVAHREAAQRVGVEVPAGGGPQRRA